jgi:glutamate-ammonia-ligase adenylyltransferase
MQALERVGCLTAQESHFLEDSYRFLRKTEHRLQLLFDLQTHRLPSHDDEMRQLALRMGYRLASQGDGHVSVGNPSPASGDETVSPRFDPNDHRDPLEAFLQDYRGKTALNRKILDHLVHQTFEGGAGQAEPESDLILDPLPDPDVSRVVLEKYGFRDVQAAYHNLCQLAHESVPFLSTRRCRLFLASIAPQLLRALAETPDPDAALVNLENVTATLGAKAVLWELFSFNPPSLKLYVDLCAWSRFLSEILISNPGMIDELLDSLVLNQPRTASELREELTELCRNAADHDPILHSFQKKEMLRIGVRDILGKDSVEETAAALSELAETILAQIADLQCPPLEKRFGLPYLAEGPRAGQPSRYALLALGKLGGREMSYHSDLDLILVYEGDGQTGPPRNATRFDRFVQTSNFHFFTEFAQRIIKSASILGPLGRLYQVDMRLRPTGKSGSLVIPLTEFQRYYFEGEAQLWERQALTRARVVHGDGEFGSEVMQAVTAAAFGLPWKSEYAHEIQGMRERLEASRSERDLKRGFGGIVDVEFLVQLLQLHYGRDLPELRTPNTRQALRAAHDAGLLSSSEFEVVLRGYDFLRNIQNRLRIVHNRSLDELPETPDELDKFARRLGYEPTPESSSSERLLHELEQHTSQTRAVFLQLIAREQNGAASLEGRPTVPGSLT